MRTVTFNTDSWLRFLADFDPIEESSWYRYFKNIGETKQRKYEIMVRAKTLHKTYHPALPQDDTPSPLAFNLSNIYGQSSEQIWDYINAYRNTQNNIIINYLGLDGLEQLFSSYYFQFEWMMHVKPNFVNGDGALYRDHFLHQTRNAWVGYVYLHQFEWMRNIIDWLDNNPTNTIVEHINHAVALETSQRLRDDGINRDGPLHELLNIYIEEIEKADTVDIQDFLESHLYLHCADFKKQQPSQKQYIILYQLLRFELIQSTWFIAALLHDIGYPIQYIRTQRDMVANYLPSMNWPEMAREQCYDDLQKLLKNSLLFKVVQEKDLHKGFIEDNHGTISALVMLNHFYQQGTVHSFSAIKQCAIDWAAVCIQQHTQRFQASLNDTSSRYVVDEFKNNALGYLLRMVDDLQEFDRFYFNIQNQPSTVFCSVCGMPLIHQTSETDLGHEIYTNMTYSPREAAEVFDDETYNGLRHSRYSEMKPHVYHCLCQQPKYARTGRSELLKLVQQYTKEKLYPVEQCKTFPSRHINTLVISREMNITLTTDDEDKDFNKQFGYSTYSNISKIDRLDIFMDYDNWAMLLLQQIDPVFINRRISDINVTKRMLKDKVSNQAIRFFVTENPVWMKAQILFDWLALSNQIDSELGDFDDLCSGITGKINQLICEVYLGTSMCPSCEAYGCGWRRKAAALSNKTKLLDEKLNANYEKLQSRFRRDTNLLSQNKLPRYESNACPAAENAYRIYRRVAQVYAPILVVCVMLARPSFDKEPTSWVLKEVCPKLDEWFLGKIGEFESLVVNHQKSTVNNDVITFMMDFRERCLGLWYVYHVTNQSMFPSRALYYRQFEFSSEAKKAMLGIHSNIIPSPRFSNSAERNEFLKWYRDCAPGKDSAKLLEVKMREDMLQSVRHYTDNRTYRPHLYLAGESPTEPYCEHGAQRVHSREWSEVDFFSDLKLILTAHRLCLAQKARDKQEKMYRERNSEE